MPRTSKTSDGAASSSAAGGGEETTDGAKKRQKLTVQDKDQLRELKRRFSQDMYAMAVAYLKKHLERLKTEGRGDCYPLSVLAGHEVQDEHQIKHPSAATRKIVKKLRGGAVSLLAGSAPIGGIGDARRCAQ